MNSKKEIKMKKYITILAVGVSVAGFAQAGAVSTKTNAIESTKTITTELTAAEKAKKAAEEKASLPKPYNANENAEQKINELVMLAKKENKNIILQAGGNWCIWCLRFNKFVLDTPELKSIVDENYLYYHLNYSPENKNEKVFEKYGNPGDKFGYPVFIVLDKNGKMIHVQDSAVLESGKGYSIDKVKDFFNQWVPKS